MFTIWKNLSRVILGSLVLSAAEPFPAWSLEGLAQCPSKATVSTIEAVTPGLTFKGNTCGSSNTLAAYIGSRCNSLQTSYPGQDVIYKVILHKGNSVGFQLDMQKPADLTMALVECGSSNNTCVNSSIDYRGSVTESIAPFGYEDGIYYLYIDSRKSAECGPYTLRVTGSNPTPDLDLSLSTDGSPTAGKDLTYKLTIRNAGKLTARNVRITQTLPSGIERARSSDCKVSGNSSVSCTIPILDVDQTIERSVTVFVKSGTRDPLRSVANAVADEEDPTPNEKRLESKVRTDVSLSFQNNFPAETVAGRSTTYTLTLSNNGHSDATKVKVNVSLPQDMSCTVGVNGCTNGKQLNYIVDRVKTRSSVPLPVIVHVSPSASGALSQSVSVISAAEFGSTTPPVLMMIGTQVRRVTNLSISMTGPKQAAAGTTLSYQISIENKGPSDSTKAIITDVLPQGFRFNQTPGCNASENTITCEIRGLRAGKSAPSLKLEAFADPSLPPLKLVNSAAVQGQEGLNDPIIGSKPPVETQVFVQSDMLARILKVERLSWTLPPTSGGVKAGENLLYTVSAANINGPSDFHGGSLKDELPAGLSFVSSLDGCSATGRVVDCPVPALRKGQEPVVRSFVVRIEPWKSGLINHKICIKSPFPEHELRGEVCADTSPKVETEADLSLALSDSPDAVGLGEKLTYTVSVKNEGPSNTSAVTVDLDGSPIEIGDVNAGTVESRTVTVDAPNERGVVKTEAHLDNDTNNSAETSTTVATQDDVDLAVSLSVDAEAAIAGRPLTYELTLLNQGFSTSGETDVSVSFSPAVTVSPSNCCRFAPLGHGASKTQTLTVDVVPTVTGPLIATADILQADSLNLDNNSSSVAIPVVQTTADELCANWSVRFLNGQPAGTSTDLLFSVPGNPLGSVATGRVFTEAGVFVQTIESDDDLRNSLLVGSGSIEWTFGEGFVGNVSSVHKRDGAMVTIPGFCRRHAGAKALILPSFQVDSAVNTFVAIRNEIDEEIKVRITYSRESGETREQTDYIAVHGVWTLSLRAALKLLPGESWTGSLEIEAFRVSGEPVEALSGDFIKVGPPDGLVGLPLEPPH